jgi:hypothetical protein
MDATRKLQKVSFWRFSLMARVRMLFVRFFEQNPCNSLIIILPNFIHRLKTHFYQYISCLCVDQRQAYWLVQLKTKDYEQQSFIFDDDHDGIVFSVAVADRCAAFCQAVGNRKRMFF